MADAIKNFAYGTVLTAPSPATSGTSLVLNSGQGANFAVGNAVCWPSGVNPLSSNAEIVRVTAVSTDTLTITRAQEGTTAQSIAVGWQVEQGTTAALLAQYMAASVYDAASIAQQVLGTSATQTVTNKRITKRTLALSANSATPAVNTDSYDVVHITGQTVAITGFTMTGTPVDGDNLRISITATAATTVAWGTSFEASAVALPTLIGTTRLDAHFNWNTETSKWRFAWATGGAIAAGSVGSASAIPVLTYNAEGQLTAVSSAAPAAGALTNYEYNSSTAVALSANTYATGLTTASLPTGTYLLLAKVEFVPTVSPSTTVLLSTQAVVGTATATFGGFSSLSFSSIIPASATTSSSIEVPIFQLVNITVAGTINIQGQSSTANVSAQNWHAVFLKIG